MCFRKWTNASIWAAFGVDVVEPVHAAHCLLASDVDVEDEGCDGGEAFCALAKDAQVRATVVLQSEQREREQSLVDSADHDANIFAPVLDVADIG